MDSDPAFVKEIDANAARGGEASKEAAMCLQAMRSVICGQGRLVPSATAYFAATVAALQRHCSDSASRDPEAEARRASALLLILRRSLTAAPAHAVHGRLADVVAALTAVLKASERSDKEIIARKALGCLAVVTGSVYDAGSRPNRKVLKPIFASLSDQRASVRQQAQLAATLVLKRAATATPSDQQTLEFASQHLVQIIAAAHHDKKSFDEIPAQHAVVLLKAVATCFPLDNLGNICQALLALPAQLGQHPCCIDSFNLLASLLGSTGDSAPSCEMRSALGEKLLPGLLAVRVTMLNVAYVVAYAGALSAAVAAQSSGSIEKRVRSSLPAPLRDQCVAAQKKLLAFFSEKDPTLLRGTKEACLKIVAAAGLAGDVNTLEEILDLCRPVLGYEFKFSWLHAFPVFAGAFDALGQTRTRVAPAEIVAWTRARFERAQVFLKELVQIRDKARGAELAVFGKELTQCLGSAIATFGPEHMLAVAKLELLEHPLSDPGYEYLSRSWLLLDLRENTRQTSIAFFTSFFLPLAGALRSKASQMESASAVQAKRYRTLVEHVWALLPAFFDQPFDLSTAVLAEGGKLAKQLVAVLLNEPEFRDYVWLAFTRACDAVREPPSLLSETLRESNQTCLRTLSSRVMPEMFNAYIKQHAEGEGHDASRVDKSRLLALNAMQSYTRVADVALVGSLFKNLVARILKATAGQAGNMSETELAEAVPLTEVANALVPYLAPEFLELVLKVFGPLLSGGALADEDEGDTDIGLALQKAAYRAISSVLQHPATSKLSDPGKVLAFWPLLRDSRQTCMAAALKSRLAAMQDLMSLLQVSLAPHFGNPAVRKEFLQCLTTVLPEVLLHLRDPGTSVREAARDCLHLAATTAMHQELQVEIITLLSAGLAGLTRDSKAAAVDALSRVLYEHSAILAEDLQCRLAKVVLLLLEDVDGQVFRAALKFVKVLVYVIPKEKLELYVPQIMRLFEHKHLTSAKMLVRKIMMRLVRIFPPKMLSEAFPKAHLPLLTYVQRLVARAQRPKSTVARGDGEEEQDDDDGKEQNDAAMEDSAAPTGRGRQSWEKFQEDDDDEDVKDEDMEVDHGASDNKKAPRKRARGGSGATEPKAVPASAKIGKEPPTSVVMAHDAVQALLDAWENESDDEDGASGKRRGAAAQGGKRKRDVVEASTWIHEDQDVPLDFMSADAAHSVLTVRPPQKKRQRGEEVGAVGARNRAEALRRNGLCFAEDGRLIVADDGDMEDGEEDAASRKKFTLGTDNAAKALKPLSRLAAQRRARIAAKAKARQERRGAHLVKGLESSKRGKRSQGDATRKGASVEPYAYVRLNPKVAKEKYKSKAMQSFAKVVKGAKQGVVKGLKAKARDAKLRRSKQTRDMKKKRAGQKPHKPGAR